jgi:hypothetical protein
MKIIIVTIFICLCFGTSTALCEDSLYNDLINAKTIRCYWGKGAVAESGTIGRNAKIKINNWSSKPEESLATFDSIDLNKGTARFIANAGAVDVTALASDKGITFIEMTPSGGVNMTTVYAFNVKNSTKLAVVHSRHIWLLWTPLPSQYYGEAEIIERNY